MTGYTTRFVWVFNGADARFPAGIFENRTTGEEWIAKHQLSGVLTKYPLGIGAYDWAIATGSFQVREQEQSTPEFIARFGCASFEHYHYEHGAQA